MLITDEVNWSFFDFLIMGIMLSITGLALGIIIKKIKYHKYRNIFIAIIIMIFVLIWAELELVVCVVEGMLYLLEVEYLPIIQLRKIYFTNVGLYDKLTLYFHFNFQFCFFFIYTLFFNLILTLLLVPF